MTVLAISLAGFWLCSILGAGAAWWMRRRTTLSVRNLYLLAAICVLACAAAIAMRSWPAVLVVVPLSAAPASGTLAGRRWRLSDLGAGEELRDHELARRWIWQPAPSRAPGERVYLRSQGEIIRERRWPDHQPFVPMTSSLQGPRLPRGEGQHIFACGGTGTGKTTTALRIVASRALADHSAVLAIDQKGDVEAERMLRTIAAAAHVPFVLIDPRAADTDRWQPISGTVGEVVARTVEPIKATEEYYSDNLRLYLGVVTQVLEHAGCWPPSLPFLIDCCQLQRFPKIRALAAGDDELLRRVSEAGDWIASTDGRKAVAGGAVRLQVVIGEAWRSVLTPRVAPSGEHVAVSLARAIRERAVVLWHTYVDDMPNEAAMITVLALADMYAAAQVADAPWTLLLDEFGGVMHIAASRALAMLQRGRSHHGQVIVVTQSAADPEALTGQTGLLASLTDNFIGFAIHRQNAPETRDWLAKLTGTTALWQSTDRTTGHGATHSGEGSRRRVRQFRISSDTFAQLGRGEAVIYSTVDGAPRRARVLRTRLPLSEPERIGTGPRHATEMTVDPAGAIEQIAPSEPTTTATRGTAVRAKRTRQAPELEPMTLFKDGRTEP